MGYGFCDDIFSQEAYCEQNIIISTFRDRKGPQKSKWILKNGPPTSKAYRLR